MEKQQLKEYLFAKDKLRTDKFEPSSTHPDMEVYNGHLPTDAVIWAGSILSRVTLVDAAVRKVGKIPFPHEQTLINNRNETNAK